MKKHLLLLLGLCGCAVSAGGTSDLESIADAGIKQISTNEFQNIYSYSCSYTYEGADYFYKSVLAKDADKFIFIEITAADGLVAFYEGEIDEETGTTDTVYLGSRQFNKEIINTAYSKGVVFESDLDGFTSILDYTYLEEHYYDIDADVKLSKSRFYNIDEKIAYTKKTPTEITTYNRVKTADTIELSDPWTLTKHN